MMGRQLLTSGVVALAWLSTGADSADAQSRRAARMRFEVMDLDRNGEISRDEWRGSARSFDVHDWNGDGRLSGDEVSIDGRQNDDLEQADHTPSRAEQYQSWTARGFASLDHDQNRRITPNEWHYDRETFLRADRNRDGVLDSTEFIGADMDDDRGDRFEYLDADNNGRIERDEWHASADAFRWLDRDGNGVLSRAEVAGEQDSSRRDQFSSLDMNGDDRIGRNEWHWSARSFAARDLDGDGSLSRSEFAATEAGGTQSNNIVRVDAQQRWTDTGLEVRAGDTLTFSSQGTIQMSNDANDTATPAGARSGRDAPKAPVNVVAGALIARIGNSQPFPVGDQTSITAPASGRLQLGVNDDHLADNRGEFEVRVSVGPGRTRGF